jgi:serine/threonine-protein kinase HipA
MRPGLIEHTDLRFGPLPGLFDDSLPDGWGLLLMDRHFRSQNIDPATLTSLDRLAYLGCRTMGALTYHPHHEIAPDDALLDLYGLGENAMEVFDGEAEEVLPELIRTGGSPGGARPKALVGVQDDRIIVGEDDLPDGFQHWLVKFASHSDAPDAGPVEFAYSLMARAAGINMPETRLFPVSGPGGSRLYFAVRRFDRGVGNRRRHVHTFANLVHANFRLPSVDYADIARLTRLLTRDRRQSVELFRRMLFNIAAHNQDDHAKNFAYLLDQSTGEWSLSPAYDLTCCTGPGGEHTSAIMGEGRNPTREHCLALADNAGIQRGVAISLINEVNAAVSRWETFAAQARCTTKATDRVRRLLRMI